MRNLLSRSITAWFGVTAALLLAACGQPPSRTDAADARAPAGAASDAQPRPVPEPGVPAEPAAAAQPPAAAQASAAAPTELRVVGTEPFWGIRVEGERLHFSTAEDPAGKQLVAPQSAQPDGFVYAGGEGAEAFELRLTRGTCSDGMSDRTYAYNARFRFGATDYAGCADTAEALASQPAP